VTHELEPLSLDENARVPVHREWCGWRTALVRMSDLGDVHWFQPPGAPRALVHAYVNRANLLIGDLTHEDEDEGGDRLLVCVLKSHLAASTYAALVSLADQAQAQSALPPPV
jgi:hypothetical protein